MKENNLDHIWKVTPKEARAIQEKIRGEIKHVSLPKNISTIAGADVSSTRFDKNVYAGIIVLKYPELTPLEHSCVKMEVNFPYIPGLLSFREIPALLEAWAGLKNKPDMVMVDGQGIAHPRRLGIGAHFGLAIGKPTVGAAKSPLYGDFDEPGMLAGDFSYITDPKASGEKIGVVMRTKNNVKPMYISPGHLCSLEDAHYIARAVIRKYRLTEPTRLAHELVNKFRRGEITENAYL